MSQKKEKDSKRLRSLNKVWIPASVLDSLDNAQANLLEARLTTKEEKLFECLLNLAQSLLANSENATAQEYIKLTFGDIQAEMEARGLTGSSKRALYYKLDKLVEAGFFHVRKQANKSGGGGTPARNYILHPIHERDFESKDMKTVRILAEGRRHERGRTSRSLAKLLEQSTHQVTDWSPGQSAYTENVVTGLCDRAQRFSTMDVVKGNRITSGLRVRGVDIHVQATTSTGAKAELAALADQRVTRALITEICLKIDDEINQFMANGGHAHDSQFDWVDEPDSTEDAEFEELSKALDEQGDGSGAEGGFEDNFISKFESDQARLEKEATARIKNDFFIDVTNLCRRCEYASPSSSSARRFVNQSLRRQYDTNYRIRLRAEDAKKVLEVMRLFGLQDHTTDIRFITSLKSQFDPNFMQESLDLDEPNKVTKSSDSMSLEEIEEDIDPYNPDEIMRVRYWRVSLDPMIFNQLLNRETRKLYVVHPQIMAESSGLGQTLYNVFSAIIGRTNQAKLGRAPRVFDKPVNDLHNHVWPTRSYHRFEEELVSLMKKYTSSWDSSLKDNTVSMWGYLFRLYDRNAYEGRESSKKSQDLWIRVTRDPNDHLAGDSSYYNRSLAARSEHKEPATLEVASSEE